MSLDFRITDKFEDNPNPEEQRFFYLMGFAISRWANVDRELFHYCRFAMGGNEIVAAQIYYGDNKTIGGHLGMAEKLLDIALPNHLKGRWDEIVKAIKPLLPTRNALAHDPVNPVISAKVQLNKGRTEGVVIDQSISYRSEKDRSNPKDSKPITETDLVAHIHKVMALLSTMMAFSHDLPKRPARQRAKSRKSKAARLPAPKKSQKPPRSSAKPR